MESGLGQDITYMITKLLLQDCHFETAVKLATTCKASYENLYWPILIANYKRQGNRNIYTRCGYRLDDDAMLHFVKNNMVKMIREYLLVAKSCGFTRNFDGFLLEAIEQSCSDETMLVLLEAGLPKNYNVDDCYDLVSMAVIHDRVGVCKALIRYGALMYLHEHQDWPYRLLQFSKGPEIISALLEESKEMQAWLKSSESDVLNRICNEYHPREVVVELCLDGGASIDTITDGETDKGPSIRHRVTPLNTACRRGHVKIARLLLELGASTKGAAGFKFEGPELTLQYCHEFDNPYYKTPRKYKPPRDVNLTNGRAEPKLLYLAPTPLYSCLETLTLTDIFDAHHFKGYLPWRYFGVHSERDDYANDSALFNRYETAKVLLEYGAVESGLWTTDGEQRASLTDQLLQLRIEGIQLWGLFYDHGLVDVLSRNDKGQTLLLQLVARWSRGRPIEAVPKPQTIRFLLEHGADPNAVDGSGLTPLHYAILYEDLEAIKTLLEFGVDPTKATEKALPPIFYAYGKPFPYRGPVIRRILGRLASQFRKESKKLYTPQCQGLDRRYSAPAIKKTNWNPIVSRRNGLSPELLEVLGEWADKCRDGEGRTPLMVAESLFQ